MKFKQSLILLLAVISINANMGMLAGGVDPLFATLAASGFLALGLWFIRRS